MKTVQQTRVYHAAFLSSADSSRSSAHHPDHVVAYGPYVLRSPASVEFHLFGHKWWFAYAGDCEALKEYRTLGEPLQGNDVIAVRAAEFLRDRMHELMQKPENNLQWAIQEGLLTYWEVFEDSAFDFVLCDGELLINVLHRRPLLVHRQAEAPFALLSLEPGELEKPGLLELEASASKTVPRLDGWMNGSEGLYQFLVPGRARGKMVVWRGQELWWNEPVW